MLTVKCVIDLQCSVQLGCKVVIILCLYLCVCMGRFESVWLSMHANVLLCPDNNIIHHQKHLTLYCWLNDSTWSHMKSPRWASGDCNQSIDWSIRSLAHVQSGRLHLLCIYQVLSNQSDLATPTTSSLTVLLLHHSPPPFTGPTHHHIQISSSISPGPPPIHVLTHHHHQSLSLFLHRQ